MASTRFRFIHAADLQLDQAFHGIAELPAALRDVLVDAPLAAAERVFDAAIDHDVQFVVLAGSVLSPRDASPRAISVLLDQFEKLGEHGIAIYWSAGDLDTQESWLAAVQLPQNVQLISGHSSVPIRHRRDDRTLASVFGARAANVNPLGDLDLAGGLGFKIGVAHGPVDEQQLAKSAVDYWAVGPAHHNGRYQPHTTVKSGATWHYPGTHQGRSPHDAGPRGCTLVTVSEDGAAHLEALPTNVVCWYAETATVDESTPLDQLQQKLGDRMLELADVAGDRTSLVTWKIEGPCAMTDRLLDWLRDEFGGAAPVLWTVSVDEELPSEFPASWRQEDTLLGDFLRGIDQLKDSPQAPIDVQRFLSAESADGLASAVQLTDPVKRRQVLREATSLGVELFRGKEAA